MTELGFTVSEKLKTKGIKNIEYTSENDGITSISIYRHKYNEPWIIPVSPKFEEIFKLLDTFIDGQLDDDTKQELKECIKDNLVRMPWYEYTVEQEATYEEWSATLREKYKNLQTIANNNFKGLWESVEFELSAKTILNIQDITLPFAGFLLGPSGGNKTLGLELFRTNKIVLFSDKFSARSFVSHSTAVKREELKDIDLLPKMKNKFFLTPELSTMFGQKDEDLMDTLSIITRIVDGHGFESDTGAHGHRGYPEDIMFTWVGAVVDITWKVHKCLGTLGPKLYFYRVPLIEKKDSEYAEQMENDDFNTKMSETKTALIDYLEHFDQCPKSIPVDKLIKIKWNHSKDDKNTTNIIVKLGKLLAHLRALVSTYERDDEAQGIGYDYTLANREDPQRAMTQLRNLGRGHALSQGRNYLTLEDMPLLIKVVFSTASIERVRVFELLMEHEGKMTTSQIAISLNVSNNTAKRTMAEFIAIGLVDLDEIENREYQITLKEKFNWFLSDAFEDVRRNTPYYSKNKEDPELIGGLFPYDLREDKEEE